MNTGILNILLADDDKDDCLFFSMVLDSFKKPLQFASVGDGEKLMNYLEENILKLPDVLFLDLNMPRKNGFESLSEIRQNKKMDALPIIIFSTSFEKEMINQLYASGANYYIRKPADFIQFKRIIHHTIELVNENKMVIKTGRLLQPSKENFVLTNQNCLSV
jgi:CheY-like chemotaxis protein